MKLFKSTTADEIYMYVRNYKAVNYGVDVIKFKVMLVLKLLIEVLELLLPNVNFLFLVTQVVVSIAKIKRRI